MRDERKKGDDCCYDDPCCPSLSSLCWSPSSMSILLFLFYHLSFLFLLPRFLFRLRLLFLLCCLLSPSLDVLLLVVLASFFLLDVQWFSSSLSWWLSLLFSLCCPHCLSSIVVVVVVASLSLMHLLPQMTMTKGSRWIVVTDALLPLLSCCLLRASAMISKEECQYRITPFLL